MCMFNLDLLAILWTDLSTLPYRHNSYIIYKGHYFTSTYVAIDTDLKNNSLWSFQT